MFQERVLRFLVSWLRFLFFVIAVNIDEHEMLT
ncbi:hypothetical protein EcWSU1_00082 [Enterobacter ludwigii]|uniref:Uncharacterized protein n=1 Tax=Enterobacter ludwigii TaxID=299767 RepID=G8LFN7_9ENTR|nr:hypothetical protein EcWSU1_00082 [Enterobacter ludwigii]